MDPYVIINNTVSETTLSLYADWRLDNLSVIEEELKHLSSCANNVTVDGSHLSSIDTALALSLLKQIKRCGVDIEQVQFSNFQDKHLDIINLVRQNIAYASSDSRLKKIGLISLLGRRSFLLFKAISSILSFLGEASFELFKSFLNLKTLRFKEFGVQLELAGLNAVPIVILVNFLIGVVLAYLSAVQLERYGANLYIVDGVALSMCRELSPILVAIVVAGRSGSAFAAQIGAMKLNEELDAMRVLGLSPMRVLVLPRLLALMIAMPLLVFVGDVSGILGGMLIANLQLAITVPTFIERLKVALWVRSVAVGLVKAPVFAFFIACIGCRLGLEVENNASSVGANTTATVVRSIVAVILVDAAFAVLFSELKI